jgi:hypothetical protein
MFIRYFLDLPVPFEDAEARLLAEPEVWVPGLARDAEDGGKHLLAEVGFPVDDHRVGKEIQIELGTPFRIPSKTILPLTWTATGPGRLFPSLEADLEIAAPRTEPHPALDQRPVPAATRSPGQGPGPRAAPPGR